MVGVAILLGSIGIYALLGALIHLRNLPSIVVTLGMSFVWQGLAILVLPKPGGKAPDWLLAIMSFKPPFVPFPIIAALLIGLIVHIGLMRTSYGVILRGSGGNPAVLRRAGWSLLKTKIVLFALAGAFGVLSGMALIGIATFPPTPMLSAMATRSLAIAGVILGGGEFAVGGRVSPTGAVIGALDIGAGRIAAADLSCTFRPTGRWPPRAPSCSWCWRRGC